MTEAYALPFSPFPGHTWAPATVEIWTDRVVVQIVAPAPAVEAHPWTVLVPECDWTLRFSSGNEVKLWAGRGDEGEGTQRCYLLFGDRQKDDRPVLLSGVIEGRPVRAVVAPGG